MSTLLVTGGAGFIGANYVLNRLKHFPKDRVVVVDALTYAGNLESLKPVLDDQRFEFARVDIRDAQAVHAVFERVAPEFVVHFAAESHVDRSIHGPRVFTETNVLGTQVLLDEARLAKVRRFLMVSTDEVYGDLGADGLFREDTPLAPNSPYSASKAAADLLCRAYFKTFGFDVVITRCSNNYGPLQFPEKLIPLMVLNAMEDKPLPVYGDGKQVRDWLHVVDHCSAIDLVLASGRSGQVYNVGGSNERLNIEVVERILELLGKPKSLIRYVQDRLGHDRRYAIDATKIREELGWVPSTGFDEGIQATVRWYEEHRAWWEGIRSGTYLEYYQAQYKRRLEQARG
jgi:dTDP-glucose 4,6-dehydratase